MKNGLQLVEPLFRIAAGRHHLNGIERFWGYAKYGLYHHCGVPQEFFHLYLERFPTGSN